MLPQNPSEVEGIKDKAERSRQELASLRDQLSAMHSTNNDQVQVKSAGSALQEHFPRVGAASSASMSSKPLAKAPKNVKIKRIKGRKAATGATSSSPMAA